MLLDSSIIRGSQATSPPVPSPDWIALPSLGKITVRCGWEWEAIPCSLAGGVDLPLLPQTFPRLETSWTEEGVMGIASLLHSTGGDWSSRWTPQSHFAEWGVPVLGKGEESFPAAPFPTENGKEWVATAPHSRNTRAWGRHEEQGRGGSFRVNTYIAPSPRSISEKLPLLEMIISLQITLKATNSILTTSMGKIQN